MTHAEIDALVNRYTYKPNWRLRYEVGDNISFILVSHTEPNANDEQNLIDISSSILLTTTGRSCMTEMSLRHEISSMIAKMEKHETHEWLRFDGIRLEEPHPQYVMTGPSESEPS